MLQMVRQIIPFLLGISLCGCSHLDIKGIFMPTGEGVEKRFEQSRSMSPDLNKGTIESQESYTFYVAADPHIDQTITNLNIFNNALRNDPDASFGVILGDCTDVRDNLQKYLDALSYNPASHSFCHEIFHVLGNHDIFFNGWFFNGFFS